MKEVEWKVLSQLMKNAKMSDRELAKRIGVSQATVSRTRNRLEQKGYIQQYATIPDFAKVGYEIMAITFVKLTKTLSQEDVEEVRRLSRAQARGSTKMGPFNVIMAERGRGLGFDGVFISLHATYQSFLEHREWLSQFRFFELREAQSFVIDLNDKIRYFPLSMANLAQHLVAMKEQAKEEGK